MPVAFTKGAMAELERSGARVRGPAEVAAARESSRPAPAPPPAPVINAEPIGQAMREAIGEMGPAIASALADALMSMPPPPAPNITVEQPASSAGPITGMDVQVLQRDANGAILRMKINVIRS